MITSSDSGGTIKVQSGAGNRLSSTISKGSTVNFSMNEEQFPITLFYDSDGEKSTLIIAATCTTEYAE
jgi:hypothetical protein